MLQRRSPPKHRHDGTSPLPLGMDWSPPPRKWDGRNTVWPHDPRTGWSYCVAIPSWVVLPKSRDSDPVVFYRVQVGVQSPEGVTTTCGVLRRFNDYMKLFTALKKEFPKKNLPSAPPKGLLHLKSRALLEERRCSLEEWMTKLLSDIDISRSTSIASFLELETAARTSFQDNPQSSEASPSDSTNSSLQMPASSSSLGASSSSIASDYGSDTAYETSEIGTPRIGPDESFEISVEDLTLDEDLTSPIEKLVNYGVSNIDEGLFMGQTILDELEHIPRHKPRAKCAENGVGKDVFSGNASKVSLFARNERELGPEADHGKILGHAQNLSIRTVGSEENSHRSSEISNSGFLNPSCDWSLDHPVGASTSGQFLGNSDTLFEDDPQVVLPLDQRHKMNRVLVSVQHRLVTAKTDMEDLLARLNQEIAVKDYLATRVTNLELELESTRQKHKENIQHAISIERERLTKMQWDMEEMKQKSLEMEVKLKSKEGGESGREPNTESTDTEKDIALRQLDATRKQLEDLTKQYKELESKSKADIKFLAKEFKSLKKSHTELKQELGRSVGEKSKAEKCLQEERELREREKNEQTQLLNDCRILCNRIQECSVNFSFEDDNLHMDSELTDPLGLLTTLDDQIGLLLAQVQQVAKDGQTAFPQAERTFDEHWKMLANIIADNASLRKQINSIMRRKLKSGFASRSNTEPPFNEINHVHR